MPNERAQVWRERSPTVGALGKRRGKVMAPDFLGSGSSRVGGRER